MIQLTAEQAAAHDLAPIGLTVELTGSGMAATLFPTSQVYLRASGALKPQLPVGRRVRAHARQRPSP